MEVENSGWKNTKSSWIENAFEENRSWLGKYKRKIMVWKYEFEKYPALGSLDLDPSPTLIIWGSWNYLRQLKFIWGSWNLFEAAEIIWGSWNWQWRKRKIFGHVALNHLLSDVFADMIFVQNFTLSDFQAQIFTPQKCVTCDIFSSDLTA